jgi:hypothetical protein
MEPALALHAAENAIRAGADAGTARRAHVLTSADALKGRLVDGAGRNVQHPSSATPEGARAFCRVRRHGQVDALPAVRIAGAASVVIGRSAGRHSRRAATRAGAGTPRSSARRGSAARRRP